MEVVEKEKETIKEVPAGYYHDKYGCYDDGYGYGRYGRYGTAPFASKGVAGTGLGLGIAGTALGLLALNRGGFGLFGNNWGYNGMPQNVNINADVNSPNSTAPTVFSVWEKECEDNLKQQADMYNLALSNQYNRFNDRQTINGELFNVWKSQVDSDFGLYKSTRDSFDIVNKRITDDSFALYKNQRDNFDALSARIGALETKQAVADAVEPWRAKVLDMRINGVAANAQAGINLEAERRCCADNKIVNYVNSNFYPISVADVTTGTAVTQRTLSNPLCGCCDPCC